MSTSGKNKSVLVKIPVHVNVYKPEVLIKCPFRLVADYANVIDCIKEI